MAGDAVLPGLVTVEDLGPAGPMCQGFIEYLLDAQTPRATRCKDGNQRCCRQGACIAEGPRLCDSESLTGPLTALGFSPHITGVGC